MTNSLVGYQLIERDSGAIIQEWGGVWGQHPGIPNPVHLPSGKNQVHCAEVGTDLIDADGAVYVLTEWMMEEPSKGDPSPQQKLAAFFAANPDVRSMVDEA